MSRLLRRASCLVAAGVAVLAVGAPPAAAHVTVHSDEAVQGAFAEIAFRVPTESATASTVKVRIAFPADQLVESVSVRPHPGWTYAVTTAPIQPVAQHTGHSHAGSSQTISEIEWTADEGSAIKPGEYDEFRIAAGPLPSADRLVFRAVQTYSDGSVARWIDLPAAAEPEHPAPVLTIVRDAPVVTAASAGPMPPTVWWAIGVGSVALLFAIGSILLQLLRRSGHGKLP
jgi:uncharacterized protein YcnI